MSEVCAPRYLAGLMSTHRHLRSRHLCQRPLQGVEAYHLRTCRYGSWLAGTPAGCQAGIAPYIHIYIHLQSLIGCFLTCRSGDGGNDSSDHCCPHSVRHVQEHLQAGCNPECHANGEIRWEQWGLDSKISVNNSQLNDLRQVLQNSAAPAFDSTDCNVM